MLFPPSICPSVSPPDPSPYLFHSRPLSLFLSLSLLSLPPSLSPSFSLPLSLHAMDFRRLRGILRFLHAEKSSRRTLNFGHTRSMRGENSTSILSVITLLLFKLNSKHVHVPQRLPEVLVTNNLFVMPFLLRLYIPLLSWQSVSRPLRPRLF